MSALRQDQFEGCLLGLALGDAFGAPFEGGILERLLWRVIGRTFKGKRRWTDDTQMSLDVAESLIIKGRVDPNDMALRFAKNYRWSRGYGPGSAKVLSRIARGVDWRVANSSVYPEGSLGNGGSMRAPVLGLVFHDSEEKLRAATHVSTIVTHVNPLAVEGAILIASATAAAIKVEDPKELVLALDSWRQKSSFSPRLRCAQHWIMTGEFPSPKVVARTLGNGMKATDSSLTAIYIAARFLWRPFEEMLSFVAACGGDVDTIGAMAGAIWGTANGASSLPVGMVENLEQSTRIRRVARILLDCSARADQIDVDDFEMSMKCE
ncbi:MAG: poly(ADP-ribose) glycohydrolase ARH3 [Planctomycetota bacterium]|jgi:poly(ADP-ribose) glycohydrolase ARH3